MIDGAAGYSSTDTAQNIVLLVENRFTKPCSIVKSSVSSNPAVSFVQFFFIKYSRHRLSFRMRGFLFHVKIFQR